MIKTIWNLIRTGLIVFGVLLSFFAVLEVVRAYQTLSGVHPFVGFAFLAVVIGLLTWLVIYVWSNLAVFPKALKPPKIDDFENATDRQLKKYMLYLQRFGVYRTDRNHRTASHYARSENAGCAGVQADP
ncbi:MAG: hypothetical protein ACYTET_05270 [Planctomycetota bacterium]|jgi:hypothetical protein